MSEEITEPSEVLATVTCHTDECGNAGYPIDIYISDEPEPYVVCGVCSQQITDITRAPEPREQPE